MYFSRSCNFTNLGIASKLKESIKRLTLKTLEVCELNFFLQIWDLRALIGQVLLLVQKVWSLNPE